MVGNRWNITYLRPHIMGNQFASEEVKIRPWADDERLQDPFQLGNLNLVIKLVQEFATLVENLPEGRMPQTQSIPVEMYTCSNTSLGRKRKNRWFCFFYI